MLLGKNYYVMSSVKLLVIEKIKNFKTSRDWLTYKIKETSSKMLQKNDRVVKSKEIRLEDYLLK